MRATIIILTLLLASTAHAQSACREYQQELERARTLYYRSGHEAGAEVTSLTSLQDACKAELRMANPVCQWVLNGTVRVMENDKGIGVAAACLRALEADSRERARTEGLAARSSKQP